MRSFTWRFEAGTDELIAAMLTACDCEVSDMEGQTF